MGEFGDVAELENDTFNFFTLCRTYSTFSDFFNFFRLIQLIQLIQPIQPIQLIRGHCEKVPPFGRRSYAICYDCVLTKTPSRGNLRDRPLFF